VCAARAAVVKRFGQPLSVSDHWPTRVRLHEQLCPLRLRGGACCQGSSRGGNQQKLLKVLPVSREVRGAADVGPAGCRERRAYGFIQYRCLCLCFCLCRLPPCASRGGRGGPRRGSEARPRPEASGQGSGGVGRSPVSRLPHATPTVHGGEA
jgi:hypothetical protein